ncbi:hypothetical protein HHX47_DHR4000198 [Lentinula edodes]|nr:hypothetical protein HHX47_DHR4000198 [Lentinula edodes]
MRNWDTRDESGTDKGCEWEKDWDDVQRRNQIRGSFGTITRRSNHRNIMVCYRYGQLNLLLNPTIQMKQGHYARKRWSSNGRPQLLSAKDQTKDQSYYLSSISEQGLARALFPLGEITKVEVRELARKYRLETAEKPESMGLCFVGERGKFNSYLRPNPGPIIDSTMQKVIGHHEGLWTYTIGENAKVAGQPSKMFVSHKDPIKNAIYVVPSSNHQALLEHRVICKEWKWIWNDAPPATIFEPAGFRAAVKPSSDSAHDGKLEIITNEPMRGVSPGQVAALWDGDWCLGCGVIAATGNSLLHIVDGRFNASHVAKQVDQFQKKRNTKSTGEGPPERSQLQKPSPGLKIPT